MILGAYTMVKWCGKNGNHYPMFAYWDSDLQFVQWSTYPPLQFGINGKPLIRICL